MSASAWSRSVRPSELDPGLQELVRLGRALAEHRAEIGVAGLPPRRSAGQVMERDGNGEVGPERHLRAVLVGGQEQAAAEILAEQFDEDAGLVDDRRLDEAVTGVGEKRAKGADADFASLDAGRPPSPRHAGQCLRQ